VVAGLTNEKLAYAARDYGSFGTVIFYNDRGDTRGFGTHKEELSGPYLNEKNEKLPQPTVNVTNTYDRRIGPHVHVDQVDNDATVLQKYTGYDPTKKRRDGTVGDNTYGAWQSHEVIR
jgi:hypothetical protein